MMNMIGNFRHVPAVIASSRLKRYATGGSYGGGHGYSGGVGHPGGHVTQGRGPLTNLQAGPVISFDPLENNPYGNPITDPQFQTSDPVGNEDVTQGHTSGGYDPGIGGFNPYTATMIGGGGLLGGGLLGDDIMSMGGGSGPGYKGLTPYGSSASAYAHELINPRVSSMDNGGMVSTDTPISEKEPYSFQEILLRQLFQESRFKPDAVSPAGATSIAQIMPDAFKDGLKKGYVPKGTKYEDLATNPKLAQQFQENLMNDLMTRSWNKGTDKVKQAKALAAYNMGPTGLLNYLKKQKAKGVDIYSSLDWVDELNSETNNYVNKILLGGDESYENEYTKLSNEFLGSETTTETKSDPSGQVEFRPVPDSQIPVDPENIKTFKTGGVF